MMNKGDLIEIDAGWLRLVLLDPIILARELLGDLDPKTTHEQVRIEAVYDELAEAEQELVKLLGPIQTSR